MDWRYFQYLTLFSIFSFFAINLNTSTSVLPADVPLQKFKRYIPGSYAAKLYDIKNRKYLHTEAFQEAESIDDQFDMMFYSEKQIREMVEKEIFPHWYDTKYDFYGQTETPGKGKIACGYFVTTVLRDAGVPIERVKMAQAASERMIKSMVDEDNIQRFRGVPIKEFVYAVEDMGEGLYVVGLDTHAGFLYNDGEEVRMIHATARKGIQKVINEKALTSPSLINSKYRVVGRISGDEDFVKRWLRSS